HRFGRAGDSPQYGQYRPAMPRHRLQPASHQAAGFLIGRSALEAGRSRLLARSGSASVGFLAPAAIKPAFGYALLLSNYQIQTRLLGRRIWQGNQRTVGGAVGQKLRPLPDYPNARNALAESGDRCGNCPVRSIPAATTTDCTAFAADRGRASPTALGLTRRLYQELLLFSAPRFALLLLSCKSAWPLPKALQIHLTGRK